MMKSIKDEPIKDEDEKNPNHPSSNPIDTHNPPRLDMEPLKTRDGN